MRLLATAFAASLLIMPACVSGQTAARPGEMVVPPTPVAVKDILYARPFTVDTPFINSWSSDRPRVSSGVLVVIEVDPAYVDPRDAALNPVLYAGNFAVIPLNRPSESGRVIGIVPGPIDLATSPIWFGPPEFPERITPATVQAERLRAERAGIRPFGAEKIAAITRPAVRSADVGVLLREIGAELVDQFSPREKSLAEAWRRPIVTVPPKRK